MSNIANVVTVPLLLFLTVNSLLLNIAVFSSYQRDRLASENILGETSPAVSNGHEYTVFLGSGTTQSDTWVDIPQSEVTINSSRYAGMEQAYFETFLRTTNGIGKAYVKLYNVTAKHDVWFSELSTEKDSATKLVAPVVLDKGEQSYRLMAKSTIRSLIVIDNARIRILTRN